MAAFAARRWCNRSSCQTPSRANPAATKRSAELFAAEVMPHFQGQAEPTLNAASRASEVREGLAQSQNDAVAHMTKKYQDEIASK